LTQTNHLILNSEVVDLLDSASPNNVLVPNNEPVLSNTPKTPAKVQQTMHAFFTNSKEFGENKQ
jgi:hypothetical protein